METQLTLLNENKPTLIQKALINMVRGASLEDAQRLVEKEIFNIELILSQKPELKVCTKESILSVLTQSINDNVTLAPQAGLVYVYPYHCKVGFDTATNTDIKAWVLQYDPTANGRLSIARQAGRILDNKRPVCAFDATGKVMAVTVEFLVPSYPTPRWEAITFGEGHFKKWHTASLAKKNSGKQYTAFNGGIDPEFAGTKAIRHGLNKLGINMNERPARMGAVTFTALPVEQVIKEASEEHAQHEVVSTVINQSASPEGAVDPNQM